MSLRRFALSLATVALLSLVPVFGTGCIVAARPHRPGTVYVHGHHQGRRGYVQPRGRVQHRRSRGNPQVHVQAR